MKLFSLVSTFFYLVNKYATKSCLKPWTFYRILIEKCIVLNLSDQNLTDISITKFSPIKVITFTRWSKFLNRHCVYIFEDLLYNLSSVDGESPPSRSWTDTVEIMNSDFRRAWGSTTRRNRRSIPIHRPVHLSGRAPR